jgi:hypothetical protein
VPAGEPAVAVEVEEREDVVNAANDSFGTPGVPNESLATLGAPATAPRPGAQCAASFHDRP